MVRRVRRERVGDLHPRHDPEASPVPAAGTAVISRTSCSYTDSGSLERAVPIHSLCLQAIQSLLYACKAKDIKSSCSIAYVSAFTTKPAATTSTLMRANEADQEDDGSSNQLDEDSGDKRFDGSLPGSPVYVACELWHASCAVSSKLKRSSYHSCFTACTR